MLVFQLKTDFIFVYPHENWLYSSLSPIQLLNCSPITENWLYSCLSQRQFMSMDNWLYSCVSPRQLLNWSPITENWLCSSIIP